MNQTQIIMAHLSKLPTSLQSEVLDYIEFLEQKISKKNSDIKNWSQLSIVHAMRGMEDEKVEYSLADIKEK